MDEAYSPEAKATLCNVPELPDEVITGTSAAGIPWDAITGASAIGTPKKAAMGSGACAAAGFAGDLGEGGGPMGASEVDAIKEVPEVLHADPAAQLAMPMLVPPAFRLLRRSALLEATAPPLYRTRRWWL